MSQLEFLRVVIGLLRSHGIEHMLVGSYASSYHGESRSTHDIDLVVDLPDGKIHNFISSFDRNRYYLSEVAFRERRMANIIDTESGDKVDLFFLGGDTDSQREFSRRCAGKVLDVEVDIATAEDVILSKLRWDAMMGGSTQQRADILNILRTLADQIDMEYLNRHAGETGTTLNRILGEIQQ